MLTSLVCVIAALVFTLIFLFGSLALLSAVIMTVAGIGNLLSGASKADDEPSPV